jgi:hypothetical protein
MAQIIDSSGIHDLARGNGTVIARPKAVAIHRGALRYSWIAASLLLLAMTVLCLCRPSCLDVVVSVIKSLLKKLDQVDPIKRWQRLGLCSYHSYDIVHGNLQFVSPWVVSNPAYRVRAS